jgi:hypothetical protein
MRSTSAHFASAVSAPPALPPVEWDEKTLSTIHFQGFWPYCNRRGIWEPAGAGSESIQTRFAICPGMHIPEWDYSAYMADARMLPIREPT